MVREQRVTRHDILLRVGDFNAVLGSSNEGFEACMGKMGAGKEMSDNEVRLLFWKVLSGKRFDHWGYTISAS